MVCLTIWAACTPTPTPLPTFTPTPRVVLIEPSALCAEVDAHWNRDWARVLAALEQLQTVDQSCGAQPLAPKIYAAHFSYAAALETAGQVAQAIAHYQAAYLLDPRRAEALKALARLDALPEPTPPACTTALAPLPDPAPTSAPDLAAFVTLRDQQLLWQNTPYTIRGVNYYPRHAPWHQFLEALNPTEVEAELDLIQAAGFNTLRIFLWYDPLFICQPEDAIPNEAAFANVDTLLRLAGERGLKAIVTLNDLPDLVFRPLYTDWARYDAQTTYIVRRYRNEPTILAWDLRNEGDLDRGAAGTAARFTQEEVVAWLAHISPLVRQHDPYHLLTAGWWGDPTETGPYVDFLSFHHWSAAAHLQLRIGEYRLRSAQPLLLEEVGYHSWANAPYDARDEAAQATLLSEAATTAEAQGLLGWMVWAAFDFAPPAGQPETYEHFFGLWRLDLTPKPALEALPLP